MQIREAEDSDIPGILKVLKASLGEGSSKKTEEVWRFKHIDNPFGRSLVLIAEENNEIIGVRAFMRWKWQLGNKVYSAFRAVDTATHPSHQGKGIFKKLTISALELSRERGDHFVFNTPNDQSKPGYLKMGWKEVDRLKIELTPAILFSFSKKFNNTSELKRTQQNSTVNIQLIKEYNKKQESKGIFTPKDVQFLKWRYENNPLQEYDVFRNKNIYMAAYLKNRGRIKELRVVEKICQDKSAEKEANKWIRKLAAKKGAHIITCSPKINKLSPFTINFKLNLGPVLTLKKINLIENEHTQLMNLNNWQYSLGDLELF